MQDSAPQGKSARYLLEQEAQTKARVGGNKKWSD
jgi:hypothetical protein